MSGILAAGADTTSAASPVLADREDVNSTPHVSGWKQNRYSTSAAVKPRPSELFPTR